MPSSLLEYLENGFSFEGKPKGGNFAKELEKYKTEVVTKYVKGEKDLNKNIAELAAREGLNHEQIKRVCEKVNNQIYLILYNEQKSKNLRTVEFDLADSKKILRAINGEESEGVKVASSPEDSLESGLEKLASAGSVGSSVKEPDMFTHSSAASGYSEFGSIGEDPTNRIERLYLAKAAEDMEELMDKEASIARELQKTASVVGGAIVSYTKRGYDSQELFKMATSNSSSLDKKMIKLATETSADFEKRAGRLTDKTPVSIVIDVDENGENAFSLGEHSFIKEASFTNDSNSSMPSITSHGEQIVRASDLMEHTEKVAALNAELREVFKAKDELEADTGIDKEALEKLALMRKGGILSSYLSTMKGDGVRSAQKDLEKAKSGLRHRVNHPSMQQHRQRVKENVRKGMNPDMFDPNLQSKRRDMFEAYDKARDNDGFFQNKINDYASKKATSAYDKAKSQAYKNIGRERDNINRVGKQVKENVGLNTAKEQFNKAKGGLDAAKSTRNKAMLGTGLAVAGAGALAYSGYKAHQRKKEKDRQFNQMQNYIANQSRGGQQMQGSPAGGNQTPQGGKYDLGY